MPALEPISNSVFTNLVATAGIGMFVMVILLVVFCGLCSLTTAYDTFAPVSERDLRKQETDTTVNTTRATSQESPSHRRATRPESYTSLYGVRSLLDP